MSEDYNKSWQAGASGTGPTPTTNWDAYQAGKSVRDWNQAELARQNQAWSQPQPTSSFDASLPVTPQSWTPPAYAGGTVSTGGGATGPFRAPMALLVGFFFLLGGFALMPILYPIAGIASAALAIAGAFAARISNPIGMVPFVGLAALVVFWFLSRMEHRIAVNRSYRWSRHIWRVLAFAAAVDVWLVKSAIQQGTIRVTDLTRTFTDWGNLVVVAVLAVITHFVLRREGLRKKWHLGLEGLRLRPTNLENADAK